MRIIAEACRMQRAHEEGPGVQRVSDVHPVAGDETEDSDQIAAS